MSLARQRADALSAYKSMTGNMSDMMAYQHVPINNSVFLWLANFGVYIHSRH